MIENADFFVRVIPLPISVIGLVSPNPDGTWNIFINSNAGPEQQAEAFKHELKHIENDDFYNGSDIHIVENL